MTVIDFELFKDQKILDKEYATYISHCNSYFGDAVDPFSLFKRIYFATRYLEGTVNGYKFLGKLGLTDEEYETGTKIFCLWLEAIIKDLEECK